MTTPPFHLNSSLLEESVEEVSRTKAVGSLNSAMTRFFYGINHRQTPLAVPKNRDTHGLFFMTRPRLNLSLDNIRHNRYLMDLVSTEKNTIGNLIRCTLDPELQRGVGSTKDPSIGYEKVECDLVDPLMAFIPFMTNAVESVSGWPELTAHTYTTPEGAYKESMSWVDGPSVHRGTYDIQLTLRNTLGDPVTRLLEAWGHYMAAIAEDKIVPYPRHLMRFEIDSTARVFQVTLDITRRYVTRISSTFVFPLNANDVASSNYERDKIYVSSNDMLNVSLRAMGKETNDPILFEEFNSCVYYANNTFQPSTRSQHYVQVPNFLLTEMNSIGYPYIEPSTRELQWWVSKEDFNERISPERFNAVAAEAQAYANLTANP